MKKNKKSGIIILSVCLLVLIAGIAAVAIAKARLIDDKHIVSGASINGVAIGGLTKEQASKKVEEYKSYLKNRKVTIKYGDDKKETDTTFERLGFYIEDDDYVEDAYNIGKKGSFAVRRGSFFGLFRTFPLRPCTPFAILKNSAQTRIV